MALKLKTPPATKPVSLTEAKAQCRVDHTDDDNYIASLIDAAVSHVDGYAGILGRCLISQVWELHLDAFPAADLLIPLGPLISVGAVEYLDLAGVLTVFASSNYAIDAVSLDGWVVLNGAASWPSTLDAANAVKVTFTAGYGAAASDVPAAIRHALLLLVGHFYANREAVAQVDFKELPMAVQSLLTPFRRTGF